MPSAVAATAVMAAISMLVLIASSRPGCPPGSSQCLSVKPCHSKLNLVFVSLNENRITIAIGTSR